MWRIWGRFRRYYDIDVEPCTEYSFKIAASEDYQAGSSKL
jgi:hypothetical protein